jgi:tetratricopeptide (TPR) repeat protein
VRILTLLGACLMIAACGTSIAAEAEDAVSIAVVPFGFGNSDSRWISEKLADELGDRLEGDEAYAYISQDDLEDAFEDLGFDDLQHGIPPDAVCEAGVCVNADLIIYGFVNPVGGGSFQVSYTIAVIASGNNINPTPQMIEKSNEAVAGLAEDIIASIDQEIGQRAEEALAMAEYQIDIENWPMAIMSLKNAISTDPSLLDARLQLADIYMKSSVDSLERAEEIYQGILEEDPEHSRALSGMGEVMLARESYEEARDYFQEAIDSDPDNASAYLGQASALQAMGQVDQAVQSFETALASNPDNLQARYALGLLYFDLGDYEAAIPHLRDILDVRPQWNNLRRKLITSYTEMGQYGEAADQANILLEQRPDDSGLILYTAQLEARAGRTTDAINRLEGLISSTGSRDAYILLATIYRDIGNRSAMQNVFSRLKSAYPSDPVANYMMGAFYYASGTEKAQVSDLVPDNLPVWRSAIQDLNTAIGYLNQVTGYRAERASNMATAAQNAISLCEEKIDRVERYSY